MAKSRSGLARVLIRFPRQYQKIGQHADAVCDYFEDLGLMLREGIAPKFFMWTMYYEPVVNYWPLLKDYVHWLRTESGDHTYYCEFENLYKQLVQLQKAKVKTTNTRLPDPESLREFLDEELQVEIRPFTLADLAAVTEIERCCFDIDAYPEEQFRGLYEKHSEGFFVAEILGRLVGYIVGYVENSTGEIDSMAVHPHDRRLGIGRELLVYMLECFKDEGISCSSLEVRTNNISAIGLYERLGFQKGETLARYYKDGADAYRMIKREL
jgi:ribosomal-protein-alanine N-acetyltransferase